MRIPRPKTLGAAAATAALLLCPLPAAADADPWDLQSRLELELDGPEPDPEAGPAAARGLEEEPFAADESVLDDFDARRARIEAHRPRAAEGSRLPTALVMQVSLRWGSFK